MLRAGAGRHHEQVAGRIAGRQLVVGAASGEAHEIFDAELPAQGFEVWVTHQVNITALTGVSPGVGEAMVVRLSAGKVHNLARIRFED